MPSPGYKGKGNVEQFKRDMAAMVKQKMTVEVPAAIADIVLDLRNDAEKNTISMLGSEPGAPDLAKSWHAGPVLGKEDGSPGDASASAAAVKAWKPGQNLYVWNSTFYGYFHENGYLPAGSPEASPKAPVGFFLAAIQKAGSRQVTL
jgi:hypothetical protein